MMLSFENTARIATKHDLANLFCQLPYRDSLNHPRCMGEQKLVYGKTKQNRTNRPVVRARRVVSLRPVRRMRTALREPVTAGYAIRDGWSCGQLTVSRTAGVEV
jgi:hypothetical protein